jgi:hypothetical protein
MHADDVAAADWTVIKADATVIPNQCESLLYACNQFCCPSVQERTNGIYMSSAFVTILCVIYLNNEMERIIAT